MLKLVYKNVKVLLTGDSGIPSEERMLKQGLDLKADIIKVGHHGSPGSSSNDYIMAVKPKYGVVSVGRNNFGHPSQFVIDILEKMEQNFLGQTKTEQLSQLAMGTGLTLA